MLVIMTLIVASLMFGAVWVTLLMIVFKRFLADFAKAIDKFLKGIDWMHLMDGMDAS